MLHGVQPKLRTQLVAALVVIAALAVSGIAPAAPGDVIQTLNVAASPGKLPEDGGKNVELQIIASSCFEDTTPDCRGEAPQVPDVERAVISLDKQDVTINPGAAKRCKASPGEIADMNPEQAESACGGGSLIGRGFVIANSGQSIETGDLTAFNAKVQAKPAVLLHAYLPSPQQGTVPVGVLKPGNKLDVQIDSLPGAAGWRRSAWTSRRASTCRRAAAAAGR